MISKFLCYCVNDGDPENSEPVDWCIVGNGKLWISIDLEDAKEQVLSEFPTAEFIEDCGWVLSGEEHKLLNRDYEDVFLFELMLRESRKQSI